MGLHAANSRDRGHGWSDDGYLDRAARLLRAWEEEFPQGAAPG